MDENSLQRLRLRSAVDQPGHVPRRAAASHGTTWWDLGDVVSSLDWDAGSQSPCLYCLLNVKRLGPVAHDSKLRMSSYVCSCAASANSPSAIRFQLRIRPTTSSTSSTLHNRTELKDVFSGWHSTLEATHGVQDDRNRFQEDQLILPTMRTMDCQQD